MLLRIIILVLFFSTLSFSQNLDPTICNDRLEEAKRSYDAGQLEEVKDKIEDCLENKPRLFSKEKMIEGYKLLTESYLFRNDVDNSTRSFESMLRFDPLFEADSTDPNNSFDLIYLSKTYQKNPIVSIYANFGTNYSTLEILQNYSSDNNLRSAENYKQFTLGYNAALGIEIPIWRNFTLALEANFAMRSYLFADTLYLSSNLSNPRQANYIYSILKFNEQQIYIDVPLMLRYEYNLKKYKKIIPYAYLGATPNFLMRADLVNIERNTSRETLGGGAVVGGEISLPISGPSISNYNADLPEPKLPLRNNFNFSVLAGIGSKFRIGSDFLIVEARYNRFILNSVNIENRYSNRELLYKYGYVDNDFRMDNFSLTIGFEKSFYKPRKKKKYDPNYIDKRLKQLINKEKKEIKRTTDSELKRELNSFIRDLERDKPGILEDVKRGRTGSEVIKDAFEEADNIKDKN